MILYFKIKYVLTKLMNYVKRCNLSIDVYLKVMAK